MFTLKHNQLVGGKWDRVLHDMVDAGSNCTITLNKGMVSAGWRWKTPDRITQTEQNITSPRTSTIPLEVEKIPIEVSTETTTPTPTVAAGQPVQVISTIKASGNPALNVPVTIQLPRDGFVNTNATDTPACQATGRGAMCPAAWRYDAANHTVTATIPRIPAGGSIKVTVTGKAGFFDANSRRFTATTSTTFTDTNQNNNTSRASFNVTNKRVTVSLTVRPEGERPASGVVTVSGSINCVTPFQHNATFTYRLNYARLVNGAGAPQVIHQIVWAGSNCTVTVRNTTAPDGWEFTSQTPFAYQLQQVTANATVQHTVRLQRKFMAVAPPLPLTGGIATDWLYLTGAGVLAVGVVAGLVARRRLRARV
ncbi:LPXTG cell wall anchor domain-containing protein [Canibacter sp. lx-72]|uniref:LPXTG cell wall anchor domain-containing protein n=1 Tax=Canibacter zhuwentaonis TaxID=2837491 RepID=UPI001BDC3567|nr:LPXTG cell wall anchor domain-containing protein [Canibacter zhuwentaonis]MBT1018730.1 LPXTG cell wall anchor domain-containing protein [Canibacter zhuwentaonis]